MSISIDLGFSHVLSEKHHFVVCGGQHSGTLMIKVLKIRVCESSSINMISISACIINIAQEIHRRGRNKEEPEGWEKHSEILSLLPHELLCYFYHHIIYKRISEKNIPA